MNRPVNAAFPEHPDYPLSLGARPLDDGRFSFRVWAPQADRVELRLVSPQERSLNMERREDGYFHVVAADAGPGTRYLFALNGEDALPDPASRFQPDGVHDPSQVVDPWFAWSDEHWHGLPLKDYIIYELHVGTFTPEGTFEAAIAYLDDLVGLGVTAIELLPVAQFPGNRNWGYDGVYPFAAQNSYGGPDGLRRLVDACHARRLAVVLDVVYNHLGPEGNYLGRFGHYFTGRYQTPWGEALNFDGRHSDQVRRYFIENALYWVRECHVDALRLDAVHAIFDQSAYPFLQELRDAVHAEGDRLNRRVAVIAESNLNDTCLIRPQVLGGYGLDSQWSDDFHHAVHTLFTGEKVGYYVDFDGFDDLVTAYRDGFVYSGKYSPFRGRRYGNAFDDLPPTALHVFTQNHDQVGNRMLGERLGELVSFEELKLAAGLVLLSPHVPLLFMGEEYAETAPFQYFVSHGDPGLVEAVRNGRKAEFAEFQWQGEPSDPQDESTFQRCKLNHSLKGEGRHATLRRFYQTLIELRKNLPALAFPDRTGMQVHGRRHSRILAVHRWSKWEDVFAVFHFGDKSTTTAIPMSPGSWTKRLDSAEEQWNGPGTSLPGELHSSGEVAQQWTPRSLAVFVKERPV